MKLVACDFVTNKLYNSPSHTSFSKFLKRIFSRISKMKNIVDCYKDFTLEVNRNTNCTIFYPTLFQGATVRTYYAKDLCE